MGMKLVPILEITLQFSHQNMDILGKILALIAALLWAFAVILFKKAGDSIKPLALNWYKTTLTTIVLFPFLLFNGFSGLSNSELLKVAVSGILGIALTDTLFFVALKFLGASLAAIVDCFYAPFIMLASWIVLSQSPRFAQFCGAGAVMMALFVVAREKAHPQTYKNKPKFFAGILAGASGMALTAISITLMQPILKSKSFWVVTELRLIAALIILTTMMFFRKDRRDLFDSLSGHGAWRHALPGSILGTVLGMTVWAAAFKFTSVNAAAILNQTTTFFIVGLASIILKEPFTKARFFGTVLAFLGVVMVLTG